MDVTRTQQKSEHYADRRVRELYRYYQPAGLFGGVFPTWLPVNEGPQASSSSHLAGFTSDSTSPAPDSSGNSNSGSTSHSSTTIGPETLVLGTSNKTLTSFAQLAALRLNVDRAFICVLDRDKQYIIAEATKSVSLNETSPHDNNDELSILSTGNRKAWSLCKVSIYDLV